MISEATVLRLENTLSKYSQVNSHCSCMQKKKIYGEDRP